MQQRDLPAPVPQDLSPARREAAPARHDLSRFLEDFRSGREPQTTQWIRLASLVASQSFSCEIVVRALRPNEKSASGKTPLDRLGESLARKVGARYLPGRLKREGGHYLFDASSLKPDVRALIVGDRETPPDTFAEIVGAISAACPGATVRSFSLQWLEEHFRSTPFDDRYFLTSASPLSVLSRESNPHRPRTEQYLVPAEHLPAPAGDGSAKLRLVVPVPPESAPDAKKDPTVELRVEPEEPVPTPPVEAVSSHDPRPVAPEPVTGTQAPSVVTREAGTPRPSPTSQMRKPDGATRRTAARAPERTPATASVWTAVALIAILVLGLGFVVFARIFVPKEEPDFARTYLPEPSLAPGDVPAAIAAVAPPAVVAEREKGPKGIVTVPSAGLRAAPSLEARGVAGTLRNNERVTILKRRVSSSGPDWVQVETKGGSVGWVWASVIREVRR